MPDSTQYTARPSVVEMFDDPTPIPTDDDAPFCSAALVAKIFEGPSLPSYMAEAIPGPHALFMAYAMDAAEEFVTGQYCLSDEQADIIMRACHVAADVALRAAGVEMSYATAYQRATAHLR